MKRVGKLLLALVVLATGTMVSCGKIEEQAKVRIEVAPTQITFESEGELTQRVALVASHSWRAEIVEGGDWLGVSPLSGEAGECIEVGVVAWENESEQQRRGRIRFVVAEREAFVDVVQNGKESLTEIPLPEAAATNSYSINGSEGTFTNVAFYMVGENLALVATPERRASGVEGILATDNYFYAAISPLLNGKEFDPTSESRIYTFISTLQNAPLEGVAPDMTEEILRGQSCFTLKGEVATLVASFELADGTLLAVNIEAKVEKEVSVNENSLSRGTENKSIRASFYLEEEGMTYLYFSPGGVDFFEELEMVTWYLYFAVESSKVGSGECSLEELASGRFSMGMVDNLTPESSWSIESEDMQDATGTLKVDSASEGNYEVEARVTHKDTIYTINFAGEPTSALEEPVVESNYILYDGTKGALVGAEVDCRGEVWSVELHTDSGDSAVVTMPSAMFDGNARGFSQSADLTVSYKGVTFSKANGYSGTVSCKLFSEESKLIVDFTNYAGCEIAYDGQVAVVE